MQHITRHCVLAWPEYWCEIDEYRDAGGQQFLLCHIRFAYFSPKVFKRLLQEWRDFRKVVTAPLYAYAGEDHSDKWVRFVQHLGFKPAEHEIVCNNGFKRQLYVSIT